MSSGNEKRERDKIDFVSVDRHIGKEFFSKDLEI